MHSGCSQFRTMNSFARLCRFLGPAALFSAALPILCSPVRAVLINISGTYYDILVTKRSQAEDPTFFSPAMMPWYTGDQADNALAYDFALAVFDQLGTNTYPGFTSVSGGPLFAYASDLTDVFAVFQDVDDSSVQYETAVSREAPLNFAYAKPAPASQVPAPLPLAGAAIAFRYSRSLRSGKRSLPGSLRFPYR